MWALKDLLLLHQNARVEVRNKQVKRSRGATVIDVVRCGIACLAVQKRLIIDVFCGYYELMNNYLYNKVDYLNLNSSF